MFSSSYRQILCLIDVQFCERGSYFSKKVPRKDEISSKEEERLWLEEKRL